VVASTPSCTYKTTHDVLLVDDDRRLRNGEQDAEEAGEIGCRGNQGLDVVIRRERRRWSFALPAVAAESRHRRLQGIPLHSLLFCYYSCRFEASLLRRCTSRARYARKLEWHSVERIPPPSTLAEEVGIKTTTSPQICCRTTL